jgi:iron-sulfur cluster assembly accessory protein
MKFTSKAIAYIKSIKPIDKFLRVKINAGGCSGLSYAMEFVESYHSHDDVINVQDEVAYVIDKKSLLFLKDVEVDYTDGLDGTGFTYSNPQATRSCGCGSSFST